MKSKRKHSRCKLPGLKTWLEATNKF